LEIESMQPTQDLLSVPRRPLDVEDYIDIVRRHKAWIIGPAFAALVIGVVVAFLLPNTYISVSTVQVVPSLVPDRYVPSNINSEMTQRINLMAQNILQRSNLIDIINTFDLYRRERESKPMEDLVEQMRLKDIQITPVYSIAARDGRQPISAFQVAFSYSNRYLAQKVTKRLTDAFITENIRALSSQSQATTGFLNEETDIAKKRLDELENRLTEFRLKNNGKLPDQLQANLQALQSLQTQLSGLNESINRIGQEKLMLESSIRINREQLSALQQGQTENRAVKSERLNDLERQIANGETVLAALKQRYSETWPDVKSAEANLAVLKKQRDDLLTQEEKAQAQPPKPQQVKRAQDALMLSPAAQELQANIQRAQTELEAKNLELEKRNKDQAALNKLIDQYSARIQASPLMDRDYAQLSRDYDLARTNYASLMAKKQQSEIATSLENKGQGERLELLDDASLPATPTKPNRYLVVGAALGIGLLLGVFVAGAREMKDTSLKNLKDARAYTNLPVLGTVPLLENDLVVRRKRRLAWLAWSAASIIGVLAMTASVYYYYATKT
jgi:polysaccharide chain length determinant protein (PEP-CTERM system associated)